MGTLMLEKFFNLQTKTVNTAALILAVSAALSRLLGVLRDSLLYRTFGAGRELDVYFAAFRVPDFIYNIIIAGGVVVAFLPLFAEYFLKNKDDAWRFANNVFNIFLFFLLAASVIGVILAPILTKLITPGFDKEQLSLVVLLSRLLFLSPILLGLSSLFSGVLQYFNKFLAYSLAPIFYNVGIILGILFLAPVSGISGVVLGVILGALLHVLIQVPSAIGSGFRWQPIFNFKEPGLRKVFSLMIARTFGVAAPQIGLVVATAIASTLPAGALSVFSFSNNLQQFPLGLVGIPFAMAAFPGLSRAVASAQKEEFLRTLRRTFLKVTAIILPLSLLIFSFREQIVALIYRYGKFGQSPALGLIGDTLGFFSLGIFASCLIALVLRAFFALKDTKTPTIIAVLAMLLNIALCFWFVQIFHSVVGLALAFSVDSILQLLFLLIMLKRKIKQSF